MNLETQDRSFISEQIDLRIFSLIMWHRRWRLSPALLVLLLRSIAIASVIEREYCRDCDAPEGMDW